MNLGDRRFLLISGIFAIAIVIIFIGSREGRNKTTGGEYVAPDTPAFLVYKNDSYLPFKSNVSNNALREDVAYYARKRFKQYDPKVQPSIVFNLTSAPTKNNNELNFSGKYEKVKGLIKIKVTELKNFRIKVSMSTDKNNINIDNELPSNSERNQYIGTLPDNKSNYTVDFSEQYDKFLVTLYSDDPNLRNIASSQINSQVKGNENISFTVPASIGEGSPVGL